MFRGAHHMEARLLIIAQETHSGVIGLEELHGFGGILLDFPPLNRFRIQMLE